MEINIQRFDQLSAKEIYEILELRCAVFVVEQECAYLDPDGADVWAWHLTAYDGEELCAYLRILEKDVMGPEVCIGRVIVKKGYRSQGLGRLIMQKALDYATNALGERAVVISAQTYLADFYEGLGFKAISEPYFEEGGIMHIRMRYGPAAGGESPE